MHATLVSHSAGPGGATEVVLSLVRHAPPGVEVSCVFLEDGDAVAAAAELGASPTVIAAGRARELWRAPAVVQGLRRAFRSSAADVVFAHVTKAHLYASPAARLHGVPYLWWQHERVGQRPLMHAVCARLPAAAVVCSSAFTAAEQRARFPRGAAVTCVHPGVEVDGVGRRAPRPSGGPVLGVVGRLQRWKRVELAVRAMPGVLAAAPGARLRVVGDAAPGLDDDYPAELRAEADRLGVADAVEFTGHVPRGGDAIGDLDLLVHCAELEPFGLVLVEALLRGVPVVAPSTGGPAEIVRDGVDGLLVDPADRSELTRAIVRLLGDPARCASMGEAGRGRALEHFSAERMAARAWALATGVAEGAR